MIVLLTQRWLVTLLAIASVGTTALVGLNVLARHSRPDGPDLRGGVVGPAPIDDPPALFTLPPFTLTDQLGQRFGSRQLRGKTWIASFIFTHCAGPCPVMTWHMTQLQTRLAQHPSWADIRLISVSVDPDRDTPAVLRQYADRAHADARHWRFLTGAQTDIWRLIQTAFKLPVNHDTDNPRMPIFHSQKFVLVDPGGQVRGYYDAVEPEGRQELLRDLDRVVSQTPQVVPADTNPSQSSGQRSR